HRRSCPRTCSSYSSPTEASGRDRRQGTRIRAATQRERVVSYLLSSVLHVRQCPWGAVLRERCRNQEDRKTFQEADLRCVPDHDHRPAHRRARAETRKRLLAIGAEKGYRHESVSPALATLSGWAGKSDCGIPRSVRRPKL